MSYSDVWQDSTVVSQYRHASTLQEPESAILRALAGHAPFTATLDIGVGAGRTSPHLAAISKQYVGVDTSDAMLDVCRERYRHYPGVRFERADAVALEQFASDSFDFVTFSHNGIDCIADIEKRRQALHSIHRVCRPGGFFAFSAHNLQNWQRLFAMLPATESVWELRRWAHRLVTNRHQRRLNPDRKKLVTEDRAIVRTWYCGREVPMVFVRPEAQIRELTEIGFDTIGVYGLDGRMVPLSAYAGMSDAWAYYLCRKPVG